MRGRLQREGGQTMAQVGLVEGGRSPARALGVGAQVTQRQFVGGRKEDQGVGGALPITGQLGVVEREGEGRMGGLAGERSRRKVSTGDDVEALEAYLAVWHVDTVPDRINPRPLA
jgi:hypothetical protein